MPSTRSTQPRLVTEPTMKPTLAPRRHSRMPTCTRCIGACAPAPAIDATSMVTAAAARMSERCMRKSPAERRDGGQRKNENGAVPAARARLCHNIGGRAKSGDLRKIKEARFRRPLPFNFCGGVAYNVFENALSQIPAKALDALAGVFQIGSLGGG